MIVGVGMATNKPTTSRSVQPVSDVDSSARRIAIGGISRDEQSDGHSPADHVDAASEARAAGEAVVKDLQQLSDKTSATTRTADSIQCDETTSRNRDSMGRRTRTENEHLIRSSRRRPSTLGSQLNGPLGQNSFSLTPKTSHKGQYDDPYLLRYDNYCHPGRHHHATVVSRRCTLSASSVDIDFNVRHGNVGRESAVTSPLRVETGPHGVGLQRSGQISGTRELKVGLPRESMEGLRARSGREQVEGLGSGISCRRQRHNTRNEAKAPVHCQQSSVDAVFTDGRLRSGFLSYETRLSAVQSFGKKTTQQQRQRQREFELGLLGTSKSIIDGSGRTLTGLSSRNTHGSSGINGYLSNMPLGSAEMLEDDSNSGASVGIANGKIEEHGTSFSSSSSGCLNRRNFHDALVITNGITKMVPNSDSSELKAIRSSDVDASHVPTSLKSKMSSNRNSLSDLKSMQEGETDDLPQRTTNGTSDGESRSSTDHVIGRKKEGGAKRLAARNSSMRTSQEVERGRMKAVTTSRTGRKIPSAYSTDMALSLNISKLLPTEVELESTDDYVVREGSSRSWLMRRTNLTSSTLRRSRQNFDDVDLSSNLKVTGLTLL